MVELEAVVSVVVVFNVDSMLLANVRTCCHYLIKGIARGEHDKLGAAGRRHQGHAQVTCLVEEDLSDRRHWVHSRCLDRGEGEVAYAVHADRQQVDVDIVRVFC